MGFFSEFFFSYFSETFSILISYLSVGLPDPPSHVQVEIGPQPGTLLVSWQPVANQPKPPSRAAVLSYLIYADGKNIAQVPQSTGSFGTTHQDSGASECFRVSVILKKIVLKSSETQSKFSSRPRGPATVGSLRRSSDLHHRPHKDKGRRRFVGFQRGKGPPDTTIWSSDATTASD